MRPPGLLETDRLRLRRPVPEDAAAIFAAYAQDPEVTRYLAWRPHRSVGTTRDFLRHRAAARKEGAAFPWVVTLRPADRPIGMIEIRPVGHRVELGYVLARPYWGRGLITEAARAVADWTLAQPEVYRLWAVCDVDNLASARVLEKVGMTREGVLRGWIVHPNLGPTPRDCACFARLKEPR